MTLWFAPVGSFAAAKIIFIRFFETAIDLALSIVDRKAKQAVLPLELHRPDRYKVSRYISILFSIFDALLYHAFNM